MLLNINQSTFPKLIGSIVLELNYRNDNLNISINKLY